MIIFRKANSSKMSSKRGCALANKRKLSLSKYGISNKRYKELCGFCEQYPEWKDELRYKTSTIKSVEITDIPKMSSASGRIFFFMPIPPSDHRTLNMGGLRDNQAGANG